MKSTNIKKRLLNNNPKYYYTNKSYKNWMNYFNKKEKEIYY